MISRKSKWSLGIAPASLCVAMLSPASAQAVAAVEVLPRAVSAPVAKITTGTNNSRFSQQTHGKVGDADLAVQDGEPEPQGEQPSSVGVGEIVVTAQKREQQINKVPMSITAVSGEDLALAGITEVRDLVKITPGFTFADSFIGSPVFTLRGIGFSDIALAGRPTVSVYVDEIAIPFAIETRGANLDLERVEILKGPQGTLFGQNSTGGAINFIAAKPTQTLSTGLDIGYGRFNAIDIGGFLSGPIADDLGVRFAFEHNRADPWQRSTTRNDELGAVDFTNARLLVAYKPDGPLSIHLNFNGYLDRGETQAGQLLAVTVQNPATAPLVPGLLTAPLAPLSSRAADWTPGRDYRKRNNFVQINGRIDYELSDAFSLTSLTSASHYRHNQLTDFDGAAIQNISWDQLGSIRSYSQELRLNGTIGQNINLTAGLNYAHDESTERNFVNQSDSTTSVAFLALGRGRLTNYKQIADQKSDTYAAFGNIDFQITDSVNIYGGLRFTKSKIDYEGCVADSGDNNAAVLFTAFFNFQRARRGLAPLAADVAPGGCVTQSADITPVLAQNSLDEDNLSWRAGVQWEPAERVLLYANVSRGYKAGSFPSLAGTLEPQFEAATQESVLAYEAGFKASLFDRTVQLNGAVFRYEYSDKQILGRTLDPTFGALVRLINVPESTLNGAELQLQWSPVEGLNINASGSYIDSKINGPFINTNQFGALTDFDGEPFPNTPKWQLSADIDYQFPLSAKMNGFLGTNVSYRSRSESQLGETTLGTLEINRIDGYALVDLRAGVQSDDGTWRLWAFGRNVFDKYYWTASNKVSDLSVRFNGMPATYGVSLSYRYR